MKTFRGYFAAVIIAIAAVAPAQDQEYVPVLAPIDPLAWAVANADWGAYTTPQIESLRKIVNGQVAAHQVSCSYTDSKTHSVMRVKCSDPVTCMICSKTSRQNALKLRQEIGNSSANAQAQGGQFAALATYAKARADALNQQAKWNEAKNLITKTETVTGADGETKTEVTTVKTEDALEAEKKKTAQVLQQLSAGAQAQAQQQGSLVGTYVNAAMNTLVTPTSATVMFAGQDPL